MLELKVEPTNPHDQFATAVIKPNGLVVGHIPKHASKGGKKERTEELLLR